MIHTFKGLTNLLYHIHWLNKYLIKKTKNDFFYILSFAKDKINNTTFDCYNLFDWKGDKMIKREKYLSELRPFYDEDLIKVITNNGRIK